jgi:dienelactone hydrolase
LLLHFAETDPNVNGACPAYETTLNAAGRIYEACVYPGTNHVSTTTRRHATTKRSLMNFSRA